MDDIANVPHANILGQTGSQPIMLAATMLLMVVGGIGFTLLWRATTGALPEQDRMVSACLLQVRAAQASEQLVEKTKGLETTQQELIDQLQVVQDQLQTMKRLLSAQQADAKKLSDQVGGLTSAIDNLRQSFASAQPPEASAPHTPARAHPQATRKQSASPRRKHTKTRD